MGISILSIVEFFYYFSLRWACAMKETHNEETLQGNDDKDVNIRIVEEFEKSDLSTVSGSLTIHQR